MSSPPSHRRNTPKCPFSRSGSAWSKNSSSPAARAGDLHFSADAHALATVFVGAFDGLKGVLEATGRANPEELRRAAGVLAEVIEATIEAH